MEVGGIRGREALDRLRNVVGRVESSWRPATAEEGFEVESGGLLVKGDLARRQLDAETARDGSGGMAGTTEYGSAESASAG